MTESLLTFLLALIAMLFACVGQAGGAGYVAVLGSFGFGGAAIKTTALTLTFLVSAIGVVRYQRAGILNIRDWLPFTILGIPCSLAGGAVTIPGHIYSRVLAALLLLAAVQLLRLALSPHPGGDAHSDAPPTFPAIVTGGVVGFLAGMTGIGGGIFLAPLLIWRGWSNTRQAGAIAQVNNLYTSAAALAGQLAVHPAAPPQLGEWAIACAGGGALGAWLGTRHLPVPMLRGLLGVILLASAVKLASG